MASERNVIIGGGQAGGRAARAMRRAGFGGDILLIGAEPHLPYERPPLSKEFLLSGAAAKVSLVFDEATRQAQNFGVRLGVAAVALDRRNQRITLADGSSEAYDRLLLATGSRLRRLALDGADRPNLHYLRTLEDSLAIEPYLRPGASILVIGGGFIGLEVAAVAAHRGARVVVAEAAARLLPRLGCAIVGDFLVEHHRAHGIDLRLGVRPLEFASGAQVETVRLSDGERLAVDLVVVGIGIAPETGLAEAAGLACDDGIITDERCATSDPAIFAAGDATRHFNPLLGRRVRLESWHNAQSQAEAAGRVMAGQSAIYAEVPWIWSDQHRLNIQVAGAPAAVSETVLRGDIAAGDFAVFQFEGDRLAGGITVDRGREMPLIRRMLAAKRSFDRALLADPNVKLRDLLK
jgi:3-phenylpropionate/trans-cinnamate dioxygenase ferredoxin reductase component